MTEDETIKNQPEPKAADTPELSDEQEAITPQIRAEDAARLVFEPAERAPEPEMEPEVPPVEAVEKKPPTRFQLFLRKALIVLGGAALVFLAGFLTDHFVRFKPLADEMKETRAQLEDANQAVSDLESENKTLIASNQKAEKEIAGLKDEVFAVRANALFYQVLVDVNAARIAMFLDDIEGAQAALADTQSRIEELRPAIEAVEPNSTISLLARLELVVSGLDRDKDTSLIDLELLTKSLLELEPHLAVE